MEEGAVAVWTDSPIFALNANNGPFIIHIFRLPLSRTASDFLSILRFHILNYQTHKRNGETETKQKTCHYCLMRLHVSRQKASDWDSLKATPPSSLTGLPDHQRRLHQLHNRRLPFLQNRNHSRYQHFCK